MMAKQEFQLKQTQQQSIRMTQQLRQALHILQMPMSELSAYIEDKALGNPLMDIKKRASDTGAVAVSNVYTADNQTPWYERMESKNQSLYDFLHEQIYLNMKNTPLRQLVLFLIRYVTDDGYLDIKLEEVAEATAAEETEVLDALTLLQQLDPPGVGARDLQEFLMLQTERDEQSPPLAYYILENYFKELSTYRLDSIMDAEEIDHDELIEIITYMSKLKTKLQWETTFEETVFIEPDIHVAIVEDNTLDVSFNQSGLPSVAFNEDYYSELLALADKDMKRYLEEKKKEISWIQQCVLQRTQNVIKITEAILQLQADYFLEKVSSMKPMTMKNIAKLTDLSISTVSRVVNDKYMSTPKGIFELRFFFRSGFMKEDDGDQVAISSIVIETEIKEIIGREEKAKPVSDQLIADHFITQGIDISRRTVAKYRMGLGIPASSKRKRT